MPILKSALKAYLERPVDDHRWLKQLTHKEIDELINDLRPRPKLYPEMKFHQKVAFYLGVSYPQFSFWLDMGSGKTLVALELIKYWLNFGDVQKALVFVLSDKAYLTWEKQAKEFNINLPITALEGSSKEKWHQLHKSKRGITLVTYPGALAMCSVRGVKRKGRRMVSGLVLVKELILDLCKDTNVLVLDESTKVGHSTSMIHKLCAVISKQCEYRYALAGRPFGRDPTLLYNQQLLIDHGETFGLKGIFQQAFFTRNKSFFGGPWSYELKFKKSTIPQLSRLMQHRSITYEAHECIDLPPVVRIRASVKANKELQAYYNETVQALVRSRGDQMEIKRQFIRMRQITSGFIGFKDDETDTRAEVAFDRNPKMEKLFDLIEELPLMRKACVFYEFTWSAKQMIERLKKDYKDIDFIWLWAGTKDSRKELNKFAKNENCRLAIIQNRVGAYSLDGLQDVSNYMFIYESPASVIDREQLERRLIRQGQKRKVFLYDLVVEKSVDERILEFHKEGKDIMREVRKDPKALL